MCVCVYSVVDAPWLGLFFPGLSVGGVNRPVPYLVFSPSTYSSDLAGGCGAKSISAGSAQSPWQLNATSFPSLPPRHSPPFRQSLFLRHKVSLPKFKIGGRLLEFLFYFPTDIFLFLSFYFICVVVALVVIFVDFQREYSVWNEKKLSGTDRSIEAIHCHSRPSASEAANESKPLLPEKSEPITHRSNDTTVRDSRVQNRQSTSSSSYYRWIRLAIASQKKTTKKQKQGPFSLHLLFRWPEFSTTTTTTTT